MKAKVLDFLSFIGSRDGLTNKDELIRLSREKFGLSRDRSVYYCDDFAVRFCSSAGGSFSNTVLSLSTLRNYDDRPFLVCLVTGTKNKIYLANTTFLKKISHSSQQLRMDNIRGSFNGSDIYMVFEGTENSIGNFPSLYAMHKEIGFARNLPRLVKATTGIVPSGSAFVIDKNTRERIHRSVETAILFTASDEYPLLKAKLDFKVAALEKSIMDASRIDNVNIRGRVIEYMITEEKREGTGKLFHILNENPNKINLLITRNSLGDFRSKVGSFNTATDIKSKITYLNSNPKGYNIDKLLKFLASDNAVMLFYFIGIGKTCVENTALVSPFQEDLLDSTMARFHWAGRDSRGVTQFTGYTIHKLLANPERGAYINKVKAHAFLNKLMDL